LNFYHLFHKDDECTTSDKSGRSAWPPDRTTRRREQNHRPLLEGSRADDQPRRNAFT